MINNCHKCGGHPNTSGMISCENNNCTEFGKEHLVYDWQKLKDLEELKQKEDDYLNDYKGRFND